MVITFLNGYELNNFDDFQKKCQNVEEVLIDDIRDYDSLSKAIKAIKNDAIVQVTQQYYGVLVNSKDEENSKEIIINGVVTKENINIFNSKSTANGLVFFNFKKYLDDDGDRLSHKRDGNMIKVSINLDCSKNTYLNIKNYLLRKEIEND
jgi:hypothetical protein